MNWRVNGGSLITGTSFYQKNLTIERAGSLTFGKGSDGQTFKVVTTSDLSGKISYKDLAGKTHYFGATSTDGTTYAHAPMSLSTPYGEIPTDKISPLSYPILLYVKENGSWKYTNAYSALPTTYGYGKEAVLLLRTDYAMTSVAHKLDTIGANSTLTIDLGGNTLDITKGGQYCSFGFDATTENATFRLVNGSIYSNGKASVVCITSSGNNTANIELSNLDITLGESFGETSALIRHGYHVPANYLATYNITLQDCDVDLSACNKDSLYAIRAGYNASGGYVLNWRVNGGSLITGKSTVIAYNLIVQTGGHMTLGAGSDGQPFKVIAMADLSGSLKYNDLDGTAHYFGAISTDGTAYTHIPMSLSTPYGDIPASRLSPLAYPFVAFEDNGDGTYTYKTASANFFTDGGMENTMRSVENGIILLRRDFTVTTRISNLSKRSNLTVDLGGHTLTTAGSGAPIESEAKSGNEVRITFENGTVLLDTTAFVNFSSYSVAETDYYITFKDIVFRFAEGTKVKSPTTFGLTRVSYFLSLCYEDCTFDLGKHQASGIVLIAANPKVNTQGAGTVTLRSVSVIGGTVKASSIEGIALSDVPSALTYGKSAGGKYLAFDVPISETASLPNGIGLVDWGFGDFEYAPVGVTLSHDNVIADDLFGYTFSDLTVKEGINRAEKTLAAIRPAAMRMNLTLLGEIRINVFLDAKMLGDADAFAFAGQTYSIADLTAENGCYVISAVIAPSSAAQELNLTVFIGENAHYVPISIEAYAAAILASDEEEYVKAHNVTYAMVEYVREATGAPFSSCKKPSSYEKQMLVSAPSGNTQGILTEISYRIDTDNAIAIRGTAGYRVTVTLSTGRIESAVIGENGIVLFEGLYINELYGEMTIRAGAEKYTYSLSNYYHACAENPSVASLIAALHNYTYHAKVYVDLLRA